MMRRHFFSIIIIVSLISGCATTKVGLEGEMDPSWSPRTSPVAVVLPKDPTIEERQLLPVVQEELIKMGYTVADKSIAVWIIGIGTRRNVEFAGLSTAGSSLTTNIGNMAVSGSSSSSSANYKDKVTINLWLFNAADYRSGHKSTVWKGTETTTLEIYHSKPKLLVQALVEIIDRNYLNKEQSLDNLDDLKDAVKQ